MNEHDTPYVPLPANPPRPWSPCAGPGCDHPSHDVQGSLDNERLLGDESTPRDYRMPTTDREVHPS